MKKIERRVPGDERDGLLRAWLGNDDAHLVKKLHGLTLTHIDGGTPEEDALIEYGAGKYADEIAELRADANAFQEAWDTMNREMWDRRVRRWIDAGHTHADGTPCANPNDRDHYLVMDSARGCRAAHCARNTANLLVPALAL